MPVEKFAFPPAQFRPLRGGLGGVFQGQLHLGEFPSRVILLHQVIGAGGVGGQVVGLLDQLVLERRQQRRGSRGRGRGGRGFDIALAELLGDEFVVLPERLAGVGELLRFGLALAADLAVSDGEAAAAQFDVPELV